MDLDTNSNSPEWMAFTRKSFRGKALPFVVYDPVRERYEIAGEAKEFLQQLPHGLAVVAIVGKYRTGKSFLLNRCLLDANPNNGFGVGPTVQPCTKGLWIHTRLQMTQDGQPVLVIDTEGIGALDADGTHDTRIFALALLLSSYFLYNSMGAIDEQAITNLSLVLNISKEIHLRSGSAGNSTDPEALSRYFPHFLWIVRDFVLLLQDTSGAEIDSATYLENALSLQGIEDKTSSKYRVRTLLRRYFPNRRCETLIRPCMDEEQLRRLDDLPNTALRQEFVQQMKQLRASIVLNAPPKKINDACISGKILVKLAESFVEAINNGVAPAVADTWDMIKEIQHRDKIDAAVCKWDTMWNSIWNKDARVWDPDALERKLDTDIRTLAVGCDVDPDALADRLCENKKSIRNVNQRNVDDTLGHTLDVLKLDVRKVSEPIEIYELIQTASSRIPSGKGLRALWDSMVLEHLWAWVDVLWTSRVMRVEEDLAKLTAEIAAADKNNEILVATGKGRDQKLAAVVEELGLLQVQHDEARLNTQTLCDEAGTRTREETIRLQAEYLAEGNRHQALCQEYLSTIDDLTQTLQDQEIVVQQLRQEVQHILVTPSPPRPTEVTDFTEAPEESSFSESLWLEKISALEKDLQESQSDNVDLRTRVEAETQRFRKQIETCTRDTIAVVETVREQATALAEQLRAKNRQQRTEHQLSITALDREKHALAEQNQTLAGRLRERDEQNHDLATRVVAQLEKMRDEKERLIESFEQQQHTQRDIYQQHLDNYKQESDMYRQSVTKLEGDRDSAALKFRAELHSIKTENVRLAVQFEHKRKRTEELEKRADKKRYKAENDRLKREMAKSATHQDYLTKEAKQYEEKSRCRQQEVRSLRHRVMDLERENQLQKLRSTFEFAKGGI